jgi:hypothetical protein
LNCTPRCAQMGGVTKKKTSSWSSK